MAKKDHIRSLSTFDLEGSPARVLNTITAIILECEKKGWTDLYFEGDYDSEPYSGDDEPPRIFYLNLYGVAPPKTR